MRLIPGAANDTRYARLTRFLAPSSYGTDVDLGRFINLSELWSWLSGIRGSLLTCFQVSVNIVLGKQPNSHVFAIYLYSRLYTRLIRAATLFPCIIWYHWVFKFANSYGEVKRDAVRVFLEVIVTGHTYKPSQANLTQCGRPLKLLKAVTGPGDCLNVIHVIWPVNVRSPITPTVFGFPR